jgi:hypothetical protein
LKERENREETPKLSGQMWGQLLIPGVVVGGCVLFWAGMAIFLGGGKLSWAAARGDEEQVDSQFSACGHFLLFVLDIPGVSVLKR